MIYDKMHKSSFIQYVNLIVLSYSVLENNMTYDKA